MNAPISENWHQQLRRAFRDPVELLTYLGLADHPELEVIDSSFRLLVPRHFAAKMEYGNPRDPLLLQVLPRAQELIAAPGHSTDPLHEISQSPLPGLIHKYHGRVLLIAAGACAINCRYCFRRHYDYQHSLAGADQWRGALDYITADNSIEEVILSGGDPLLLADAALQSLIESLQAIGHLKRLRIHSRLPITLPARITPQLVDMLGNTRLQAVTVLHSNHPRELDGEIADGVARLAAVGVRTLNQSVLLREVNDCVATLSALSSSLWDMGILPYYLHLLDPVAGAAHFDVPEPEALQLYEEFSACNPGYLVPRLVREIPGKKSKVPLGFA